MSGPARETQSILKIIQLWIKWGGARYYLKRIFWVLTHPSRTAFEDNFMPIICRIKGHKPYNASMPGQIPDYACKRCHRFLDVNTPIRTREPHPHPFTVDKYTNKEQ